MPFVLCCSGHAGVTFVQWGGGLLMHLIFISVLSRLTYHLQKADCRRHVFSYKDPVVQIQQGKSK